MGSRTVQSYHGAQVFEAIGLHQSLVDKYFAGTHPYQRPGFGRHCGGGGRHTGAPSQPLLPQVGLDPVGSTVLEATGAPPVQSESISKLQIAVRTDNYAVYKQYAQLINDQSKNLATLRGLMELRHPRPAVPLDESSRWKRSSKRFKTGAMS